MDEGLGSPRTAWIGGFICEAEGGHASKTLELVAAIRRVGVADTAPSCLEVPLLLQALEREHAAAGRNRAFRSWLGRHREAVIQHWSTLGFPEPPATGPTLSHSSFAGVVIFDFDQTLTTRHVRVFEDLTEVRDRAFGGAPRTVMLQDLLTQLQGLDVAAVVVSRNSREVIQKALSLVGLSEFFMVVFGFEDYEDSVPKSAVVRDQVLATLGVAAPLITRTASTHRSRFSSMTTWSTLTTWPRPCRRWLSCSPR